MEVNNAIVPNTEQMAGFGEPGPDGPIYMVNLLKFREQAHYEDDRETELTGEQAYAIYGEGVAKLLQKVGGSIVFSGNVERLMLGEVERMWDKIAIAMYPSRQAMLQMMQMPEMAQISVHRAAGLEGQLNIETTDSEFSTRLS